VTLIYQIICRFPTIPSTNYFYRKVLPPPVNAPAPPSRTVPARAILAGFPSAVSAARLRQLATVVYTAAPVGHPDSRITYEIYAAAAELNGCLSDRQIAANFIKAQKIHANIKYSSVAYFLRNNFWPNSVYNLWFE